MLIISHKSSKQFKLFLDQLGYSYILTTDNPKLDSRVADHPDLSIFSLDEDNLVIDKGVYDYYAPLLYDKNIIKGERVDFSYPYDSLYNVYKADGFYVHNDFTEKNILNFLKENAYTHYKIRQGYSRCSIIPMADRILTADYGIYKSLKNYLKVILLEEEEIPLDGFPTGFLGGCCGLVDDKLIFNGDISKLKSYELIKTQAALAGVDLVYPNCPLVDTGSIMAV